MKKKAFAQFDSFFNYFLIGLLVCLAPACSPLIHSQVGSQTPAGQDGWAPYVLYQEHGQHLISHSLGIAGDRFFGGSGDGTVEDGGGSSLADIDSDTLSDAGGYPYRRTRSKRIQVGAKFEQDLKSGFSAAFKGAIGLGHSRYVLPEGAGILADPIDIEFNSLSAEVEAALVYSRDASFLGDTDLFSKIELGVGLAQTQTRTKINSALLDVVSNSSALGHYAQIGIEVGLRPQVKLRPEWSLRTNVRYYPDFGASLQSGIQLSF